MQQRLLVFLCLCLTASVALVLQTKRPLVGYIRLAGAQKRSTVPNVANARIAESYGKLPLSFEVNRGQTESEVKFLSRGSGYSLFLTASEAVLARHRPLENRQGKVFSGHGLTHAEGLANQGASGPEGESNEPSVVRMGLVGANPLPKVTGVDELAGKSNYFIGNDPAKWRTNVPTYAKVRYENVYPGIDLVYYGNQRQLEFDFVVAPGADPRAIRLAFPSVGSHGTSFVPWAGSGSESLPRSQSRGERAVPLRIDGQGDLVLETEGSELRLHQPVIYQEIRGARQRIGGNFVIHGGHGERQVGLEVARYDASKPLIIDPVLSYSSYLGGGGTEEGAGIAVDSSGSAYVTGATCSSNFPTANALQALGNLSCDAYGGDAFVTKLNAAGSALVYSTYLGGSRGDGGYGIRVDSDGNTYIVGWTNSTDFPMANAFQAAYSGGTCGDPPFPCPDAFVTKLNAAGSALVYSTYLGGRGWDEVSGIAVDSSGNAYMAGFTESSDFPTANAFQAAPRSFSDAFVTKLNMAGSALSYSTYLGGSDFDYGTGIAVDSSGNAYVTGFTSSTNFPRAIAFQAAYGGGENDAFVTKLNAVGSTLVYSTYLGGDADDYGFGIAVDSSGSAYVTGSAGPGFPTANALQQVHGGEAYDAFVTKLNAAGSALVYSTYLGGNSYDDGLGIVVDSAGNAYVAGTSYSTNFPTANPPQPVLGAGICADPPDTLPCPDGFVSKLNAAGSALAYSTYLGGNGFEEIYGIAVDSSGNAYVTGFTISTNFPTTNALSQALLGDSDAFVTKLSGPPQLTQGAVVNAASFAAGQPVAAGSIAAVFGSNLASAASGGVSVRLGGTPAFLFDVFPSQINFQVPWEVAGQPQASLTVTVDGVASNPVPVNLAAFSPGIFRIGQSGQGAVLIAATGEVAAPVGSIPGRASRPAARGLDFISIYCTGLGDVTNRPVSGTVAGSNPLSSTTATPSVTIGGVSTTVDFSGLTPSLVGLYQINVLVPPNAPIGDAIPVVVTIGAATSNTATIAVYEHFGN